MHPNTKLIQTFYTGFQQLDGDLMAACYHENIQFSDPVFTALNGPQAGAMWQMLCAQARNLDIQFSKVAANDDAGSAHWEARYDFSATGRKVHNIIEAEFKFQDGKIIQHQDSFNFWKWSKMALGTPGLLLGWTPMLRSKVQLQAAKNLSRFMNSEQTSKR